MRSRPRQQFWCGRFFFDPHQLLPQLGLTEASELAAAQLQKNRAATVVRTKSPMTVCPSNQRARSTRIIVGIPGIANRSSRCSQKRATILGSASPCPRLAPATRQLCFVPGVRWPAWLPFSLRAAQPVPILARGTQLHLKQTVTRTHVDPNLAHLLNERRHAR